jgi:hypothetical protein
LNLTLTLTLTISPLPPSAFEPDNLTFIALRT